MEANIAKGQQGGWVMAELMLAIAIVMLLSASLLPILLQTQQSQQQQMTYLQSQTWVASFKDHLTAQWQRLVWQGCSLASNQMLSFGNMQRIKPTRITSKKVVAASDWLQATDLGYCRTSQTLSPTISFNSRCQWREGQAVRFSQCQNQYMGTVISSNKDQQTIELALPSSLTFPLADTAEKTGILLSEEPYIWYLATGKSGQAAFWRTPMLSGNSLELWNGVQQIALYPLLDTDQDGKLDQLSTQYGDYSIAAVKAIWVEVMVSLDGCQSPTDVEPYEYLTFRGDVWPYFPPCHYISDFLVPLTYAE